MASLLESASGIDELRRIQDPALPYRFDRIFEGEGFLGRRLAARRLKLLRRLDPALRPILREGERVEHVTWGIEYAFVEAFFLGLWHHILNRRAVVVTDRRILLLQLGLRGGLGVLKSQVRLEAIAGVAGGFSGSLRLRLRDGRRLLLTGLPRRDRKALRAHLTSVPGSGSAGAGPEGRPAEGREHLCPHCFAPVAGLPARCPDCRGGFKSAARAGWLSLAFPGLGDLYLGHRALAALEILGAIALWGILLPALVAGVRENGAAMLALGATVFAMTHGLDALVTRHTGRKGLYPASS